MPLLYDESKKESIAKANLSPNYGNFCLDKGII